jgi:DnaJ-class molecular chaperone
VNITLKEALTGFSMEFTHLDGHKVTISKPAGQVTSQGEIMKIKEEGMPKYGSPSDFGDLFVTFKVKSPTKLDSDQKEKLETFF